MTMKQAALTGFLELRLRLIGEEERQHREWERIRWLEWHQTVIAPFIKDKPRNPQELIRFPWDVELPKVTQEQAALTDGERDAIKAIFTDFINRRNG